MGCGSGKGCLFILETNLKFRSYLRKALICSFSPCVTFLNLKVLNLLFLVNQYNVPFENAE